MAELAMELRDKEIFLSIFQWWPVASKLLPELFKPQKKGGMPSPRKLQ